MKKFIKSLSVLLSVLLAFSVCSCKKSGDSGTPEPEKEPESIVYSDFESWSNFSSIRVTLYSGALHVNKDTRYAKDKQSLLIHPLGRYTSGGNATFIFPSYSETYNFDYRDFRKTKSISFDFYNAEKEVKKVAVGLTPKINDTENYTTTKLQWQDLAPEAWTTVYYEVDSKSLGFIYDVTNIAGFYMTFENAGSRDEEDAPDIYLDNIVLHRITQTPAVNEQFILGDTEFLDFEDDLQNGMIEIGGRAGQDAYIVKAADEIVNGTPLKATSGESVLKMEFQPVEEVTGNFSYVRFSDVVTKSSMFSKISAAEAEKMVISLDIYNACDVTTYIEFDFLYYEDCIFGGFDLAPHTWTTFRYRLDDVINKYPDFASHGKLRFVMSEFSGEKAKVFYLDNIRFEWAADLTANG